MSPRRTRRGVIKHNDNSTPDTAKKTKKNVISPKETPPKRRRTTRAGKAKPTSDTEENRTKSVTKKSTRKKPVKSDDSLITEDESFSTSVSSRNTTRQKNISLISEDESPVNSSQTVNSLKRMNTTPKSSPIAVTLSPHRSKKTPRRSPINLGSPKTHSDTPMKLLKTPRKLVIKNSPSSSSSSSDDSKLISSKKKPKTPSSSSSSPKVSPQLAKQKLATPPKKTPSPKKNSPIVRKSIKRNTRRSIASTLSAKKTAITPRLKKTTKRNSISPLKTSPVKLIKSPTKKLSSPMKQSSPSPKKLLSPKTKTTPSSSSSSPKVKLISPKKRTPSPSKIKLISPKKKTTTPSPSQIKLVSPKKKTPSPSKIRMISPKKKTPSPKIRLVSPKKKTPSPKIRLVSPKKKTPSPKIRLVSPKKTPIPVKSPKSSTKRSSVSKKISPRPAKLSLPVSKIRKSPVKTSKVAVVILEKVNSSTRRSDGGGSPKSPKSLGKLSPRRSNSIGSVKNTSIQSPRNRSSSVKKIILESPVENKSSSKRRSNKDNSRIVLSPTVSLRRSLNLTGSLEESTALLRKKSSTPKYRGRNRSGIENESEPEMSDTSLINMSDVFESDISQVEDKEKDKNGTYELDEPKTPGLKAKKAMKRSSPANAKRNEVESKKVRFAESNDPKENTAKLRTGTPGHRSSLRRSSEVRSKSKSPQRVTKSLIDQNQRRRSSSVSVIEGTPRTPANKKTFNSNVNSNVKSNHKTQMASVNRLSRPRMSVASEKKADTKTPVPRKIPNFAEIHKKNFEKMESLVDAKKRIADRHVAMVNPILSGTKSMPEVAIGKRLELRLQNGVYNRFGFKLRKNEAVETMSKKPVSMTSEKKLNARRDILKGVRTNRRFELQMKSRKSK